MPIKYNHLYILLAAAIPLSCVPGNSSAKAQNAAPAITFTQWTVTHPDPNTTKLVMAARGSGVAVGSFAISFKDLPANAKIPGSFERNNSLYINGGTADTPTPLLLDNGKQDEDPRSGVFAYTFDMKDWPDGWYTLRASVSNRPAEGDYLADQHDFRIKKGNVPPLQISNIPSTENRIVYQKEDVYATFPSLSVLPDGKLGTSFGARTARNHIDDNGGYIDLISRDNGKTWSKTSSPLIDRKWQTKDGRLVRAAADGWIYVDASQEDELKKQHKMIMKVRPGTIAYKGGAYFATSTDGGKSWDKKAIAIPGDCEGLMGYQSGLVTSRGVRLVAVYGRRFNPHSPTGYSKSEVYLLRSDDDGKSWKCYPMYPDGIPDTGTALNETTIEEAADGTIVAMMRSDPEGYLWEATSKDGGLTWTKPVTTSIWGFPAELLRLKDGRLLCAYGYRRYPMGIRAVLSRDNGKTWDTEHELIIRSDGLGRPMDLGYPKLRQLPDGSIFCIYYMTTDGYRNTHIASTTFTLPEPVVLKK